jgi:hypothetical protein
MLITCCTQKSTQNGLNLSIKTQTIEHLEVRKNISRHWTDSLSIEKKKHRQ